MSIGKALGDTALEIAKSENTLNKAANLMGILFPYAGITKKALDMYIEDVEKSNLPSEAKLIAVLNSKRTIKKLKNQKRIAEIAIETSKEGTNFSAESGVNEEWLERFMDSAGFVSDETVQFMWGKALGQEFEKPGSTPSNIIRILSELSPKYAQAFRKICSMWVGMVEIDDDGNNISNTNVKDIMVPFIGNKDAFGDMGLSFDVFQELETLGLIKYDSLGYVAKKVQSQNVLVYIQETTETIMQHNADEIPKGNVILTEAGRCLCRIVECENIDGYKQMLMEYMKQNRVVFMEKSPYAIRIDEDGIQIDKV